MATSAEIRNKAAKKLGLYGTGQTLRSAISADIDAAYTEVYAELAALGIATWGASDAIPSHLVRAMVALVAGARVNEYSLPLERYQRIVADSAAAEKRIRQLTSSGKHGQTPIENF